MYRFFANEDFVKDNQIFIIGEDKNHILNSIRMKIHENTKTTQIGRASCRERV